MEIPSLESFSAKWRNCSISKNYPTLEEGRLDDDQCVFFISNFYSFGKKGTGKLNEQATWWTIWGIFFFLILETTESSHEQNKQLREKIH